MYILKGFLQLPGLDSSTPNGVAPIGELSLISNTSTKTVTQFANPAAYPNAQLTTFDINDGTNSTQVLPSSTFTDTLLALGNWLYAQCIAAQIPTQSSANTLVQAITAEFPDFNGVTLGVIHAGTGPDRLMPEYVMFQFADGAHTYQVKLWLMDQYFQTQFDEFTIVVIPPVPSLATLQAPTATVLATVAGVTPKAIQLQINAAQAGFIPTEVVPYTVNCVDPNNPASSTPVTFFCVCYGGQALDSGNQKTAITEYLAANSSYTNWPTVFPSLYNEFEFVVIPFWQNFASQGNSSTASIWSSSVPTGQITTDSLARVPAGYHAVTNLTAFLAANLTVVGTSYNGLMLSVVGNPNNASGFYSLNQIFPDYAALQTDDPDSSRLQTATWTFYTSLLVALQTAATYTPSMPVPNGYTTAVFNGRTFLGFTAGLYTYYVLIQADY